MSAKKELMLWEIQPLMQAAWGGANVGLYTCADALYKAAKTFQDKVNEMGFCVNNLTLRLEDKHPTMSRVTMHGTYGDDDNGGMFSVAVDRYKWPEGYDKPYVSMFVGTHAQCKEMTDNVQRVIQEIKDAVGKKDEPHFGWVDIFNGITELFERDPSSKKYGEYTTTIRNAAVYFNFFQNMNPVFDPSIIKVRTF